MTSWFWSFIGVWAFAFFIIYFLPTVCAVVRNHRNKAPIFIVNLFLGWTFIGWVVTLAWAFYQSKEGPESKSL